MKKVLRALVVILLLGGCTNAAKFEDKIIAEAEKTEEMALSEKEKEIEYANLLLEPLLEGIRYERAMLMGGEDKRGMTIKELREWMLQYYTEELTNEICTIIVYKGTKSENYKNYYDEFIAYKYDEGSDIFTLNVPSYPRGYFDTSYFDNPVLAENIKIKRVVRGEDVIRVIVDIQGESEEKLIILEKEGTRWYLGRLVCANELIGRSNMTEEYHSLSAFGAGW